MIDRRASWRRPEEALCTHRVNGGRRCRAYPWSKDRPRGLCKEHHPDGRHERSRLIPAPTPRDCAAIAGRLDRILRDMLNEDAPDYYCEAFNFVIEHLIEISEAGGSRVNRSPNTRRNRKGGRP